MEDEQGHGVFLCFHERFQDAVHWLASADRSWYLGNHESREVQFGMMPSVPYQAFRDLLWGCHAHVGQKAATQRVGLIKVDNAFREVCTIVEEQIEMTLIFPTV